MNTQNTQRSAERKDAWRVDVLNDETALQGLVPAYKCTFTITNYWPYGSFHPQECCELPGKLFVATASGKEGCEDVFLAACKPDMGQENLYDVEHGYLFVAWRVQAPEKGVKDGRFSFVRPSEGPWQVWCNKNVNGEVVWNISVVKGGKRQNRQLKAGVLNEKTIEPAFDKDGEPRVVEDWIDVQLKLERRQLTVELNHEKAGSFEHDPYTGAFRIQFGSAQEAPGGEAVASRYRTVYVDDVPYIYTCADAKRGPEDVRPEDGALSYDVCPATLQNPRQGEGDLIELKNGDLFLAWSDFYTGRARDWAPARVSAKVSKDGGKTWGEPRVIAERDDALHHPTPDVSLVYAGNGDLLMTYSLRTTSEGDVRMALRRSQDDGESWTDPAPIIVKDGRGVHANNGCFRRLSTGRIVLSCRYSEDGVRWPYALYSDDDGFTWEAGDRVPDPELPPRLKQLQNVNEPSVAERADGRLLMTMRSVAGGQFFSYSSDGGETWTKPCLSPLRGCCAPATIRKIPGTDDILAIWDYGFGGRTPLTSAVSSDGGKTWKHLKLVEQSKYYGHDYSSVTFANGRVYVTSSAYPYLPSLETLKVDTSAASMRLTVLPIDWFYRDPGE